MTPEDQHYEWVERSQRYYRAERELGDHPGLSEVYVPPEGPDEPTVMLIGEAPDAQAEIAQRPFVGVSGSVLRQLMGVAGMSVESNAWLTNVLKHRPAGNRAPTDAEIAVFRPYLRAEWKAIGRPRVIIPIGRVALYALLGRSVSILKHSGWPHPEVSRSDGEGMWVYPMIHPSFGVRGHETTRDLMERDWEKLGEWFRENNP